MTTTGRYGDTDRRGATAVTTGPGIVLTTVPGTVLTTPLVTVLARVAGRILTMTPDAAGHDEPAGFLIATERV